MKAISGILIALFLITVAGSLSLAQETESIEYEMVPIQSLIDNRDFYDGKPIRTMGYVKMDLGTHAIFTSEEEATEIGKGLWLEVPEDVRRQAQEYDQQYCIVEGILNTKNRGRLGRWQGSIEAVTRIEVWG